MQDSLKQSRKRLDTAQNLAMESARDARETAERVDRTLAKFSDALDTFTDVAFGGKRPQSFEDAHKGVDEEHRRAVFSTAPLATPIGKLQLRPPVGPPGPTFENLAFKLARGDFQNIIVLAGAGISVSAGIPDFRTAGTGLYELVRKEQKEHGSSGFERPEDLFSIDFFKGTDQGRAFAQRARLVMPDHKYKPTLTHHFLKLLQDTTQKQCGGHGGAQERRSILKRVFTQNIDTLEKQVGLSEDALVHAHGSFADAHCIEPDCRKQMLLPSWREAITQVDTRTCIHIEHARECKKRRWKTSTQSTAHVCFGLNTE